MRINDYKLTSSAAGEAERTAETGDSSRSSGSKAAGAANDRVEVSSFTGRISKALAEHADRAEARVQDLSARFEAGTLDADARQLSRRMIASMLGAA
jgi:anti-sigma28 factor (negative regulator of flagellin synthesis)